MSAAPVRQLRPQDVKLTVLTKEQVVREWHVLAPMLWRAMEYASSRVTTDHLLKLVVEEEEALVAVAWAPEERQIFAAFFCDCTNHPNGVKVFSIGFCGGTELAAWAHLWPAFEHIARSYGCHQLEVVGRRGWGRYIDAREVATHYVKDLTMGASDVAAEK